MGQPPRSGHFGGGPRTGGQRFNTPAPPRVLLEPQPVNYYQNDRPRPELMEQEAENRAQQLRDVKTTQLRRFYDDVLTLRQRLEAERGRGRGADEVFAELRADFKLLKAKAYYAHGRSDTTFPHAMLQFVVDHVHAVNTARDFEAFCKHFQAVVAFHRYFRREEKD